VLVMMACTIPDSIGYVAQAALLGLGHFRSPSIIVVVMNALKLTVACLAMVAKGSVLLVAWIWFAGSLAAAGALLLAAIWCARAVRQSPAYEPKVTPGAWLVAGTFLGISTLLALEAQTDTLVLSATWGQESVGWYGAASTLAFAALVVPQAYRLAVFPAMARMGRQRGAPLFLVFRKSIRDLSIAGGAMAVTLFLFAPQAVAIAFGESFIPSVTALRILSIVIFLVCVNEANSRFLLATERQGRVLLHVAAATILNVALNLVLAPSGGIGASAAARLCSTALMTLLNWRLASQMAPSQSMILALLPSTLGLATALAAALIMPNMPAFAALLAGLLAFLLAYFLVRRADGSSHANDCWR
jgi:O-antigen/teichoic acid export membrane protein